MADRKRNFGGRPAIHLRAPGDRVPLATRVTVEMKQRLDAAAAASGRSLSLEIELRLEQAFRDDDIVERLSAIVGRKP